MQEPSRSSRINGRMTITITVMHLQIGRTARITINKLDKMGIEKSIKDNQIQLKAEINVLDAPGNLKFPKRQRTPHKIAKTRKGVSNRTKDQIAQARSTQARATALALGHTANLALHPNQNSLQPNSLQTQSRSSATRRMESLTHKKNHCLNT